MTNKTELEKGKEEGHRFIVITKETVDSINVCFCCGLTKEDIPEEFDEARAELLEFGDSILWYVNSGEPGFKQLEEKHKDKILTPEQAVETGLPVLFTIGSPDEGNRYYNIDLKEFIKSDYSG